MSYDSRNATPFDRVRDTDLAVRLGFKKPRDIRKLISRLISEGVLRDHEYEIQRVHVVHGVAPRIVDEYLLSELAAWMVTVSSEAPNKHALMRLHFTLTKPATMYVKQLRA